MLMRIRTIKPEFWMHEGLCSKSEFTRLLAIALLNWADDEGYFLANPVLIRGQVFPFLEDSTKIPRALQELSSVGWIDLGKDDQGRSIGRIKNFAKHQRVDKPNPSKLKASSVFQEDSKNDLGIILEDSTEEGKGREGNKEGKVHPSDWEGFEEFWTAYPRKTAKSDALKAWNKIKPNLINVLNALDWQRKSEDWTKDSGQYIPYPASYLNSKRYEDEKPKPKTQPVRPQSCL
jgi:hypothetical protein